MRKLIISILLIIGAVINANAATPTPRGRGITLGTNASVTPARSATRTPAVARGNTATTVSARSAVSQPKTVASRAAVTTQKVINSGTKVTSAAKNVAVNEECQNKYFGCMDAFCMLDNTNGGRCVCSNKNAELDEILADIEKLDQQSYQMATYGVEKIEMGNDADAVIAAANAAANDAINASNTNSSRRKPLDLSLWTDSMTFDDDDAFDIFEISASAVDGKTGDALQRAASDLCVAQIPECGADMSMLKLLYAQKIKSDCNAYENSLKQQKNASQNKLATAERALRDAALEQFRAANRYDLGQCTIEFKKCMQSTGGCGDDFSGCAAVAAMDNTNVRQSTSKKSKGYAIKGSATTIEISASTYDTLLAKKPLCETVTKQCQRVADQVWETFLKEVAPAVKSAELIAEDNARQNCIGNISQCFQKACRDNMDPNDPDGSYDMCLTRPQTMLNVCRIPLNACGISEKNPEDSQIWDFVVARLASMRVDSCTKEVKECLQSEDRCGSDYTQCIGMDTDTIMRMCPYDKLVGCQKVYGDTDIRGAAVYDEIAAMVQGVMLNIDNNMLAMCQRAADEAMIRVCGDTENCNGMVVDKGLGTRSLDYQICEYNLSRNNVSWGSVCMNSADGISDQELINPSNGASGWAGRISGIVYWGDLAYTCGDGDNVRDCSFTTEEEYIDRLKKSGLLSDNDTEAVEEIKEQVFGVEMRALTNTVNSAISAIESDPTVQYCMYGREVQGMNKTVVTNGESRSERTTIGSKDNPRFPSLTMQMRQMIAAAALREARTNYNKKYDEVLTRLMRDQVSIAERIDKDAAIKVAAQTCKDLAENSVLPETKAPEVKKSDSVLGKIGGWLGAFFTGPIGMLAYGIYTATSYSGEASDTNWNYKEKVNTMFDPTTGICTKVVTSSNCEKTKKNYCAQWGEVKETRTEIKLF